MPDHFLFHKRVNNPLSTCPLLLITLDDSLHRLPLVPSPELFLNLELTLILLQKNIAHQLRHLLQDLLLAAHSPSLAMVIEEHVVVPQLELFILVQTNSVFIDRNSDFSLPVDLQHSAKEHDHPYRELLNFCSLQITFLDLRDGDVILLGTNEVDPLLVVMLELLDQDVYEHRAESHEQFLVLGLDVAIGLWDRVEFEIQKVFIANGGFWPGRVQGVWDVHWANFRVVEGSQGCLPWKMVDSDTKPFKLFESIGFWGDNPVWMEALNGCSYDYYLLWHSIIIGDSNIIYQQYFRFLIHNNVQQSIRNISGWMLMEAIKLEAVRDKASGTLDCGRGKRSKEMGKEGEKVYWLGGVLPLNQ